MYSPSWEKGQTIWILCIILACLFHSLEPDIWWLAAGKILQAGKMGALGCQFICPFFCKFQGESALSPCSEAWERSWLFNNSYLLQQGKPSGTKKSFEPEPNANKLRSESRRVTSVRSSWVQNVLGFAGMERELLHAELLMRKLTALPYLPLKGLCESAQVVFGLQEDCERKK